MLCPPRISLVQNVKCHLTGPIITCPRCKRNISPDAKYCSTRGLVLDLNYATEDQKKKDIKEKIEKLSAGKVA